MLVIASSLLVSILQVLFFLITSRFLGGSEYSSYSFIIVAATLASALCYEWLRMILARFAGIRQKRLRLNLLWSIRLNAYYTSIALVTVTVFASVTLFYCGQVSASRQALALGAAALGIGAGDLLNILVRFSSSSKQYATFAVSRSAFVGGATVATAAAFHRGLTSVLSFALSNVVITMLFWNHYWPSQPPRRAKVLRKFVRFGGALALSSISTNLAITLARSAMKRAFATRTLGAVFLVLDLTTKGITVLGQAFNLWSARLVFDRLHSSDLNCAVAEVNRVSPIFCAVWGVLAVYGAALAFELGSTAFDVAQNGVYTIVTSANIAAVLVLSWRLYSADMLLAVANKPGELLIASAALGASSAVVAAAGWFVSWLGALTLPIGVSCSTSIYIIRNWDLIRRATPAPAATYVALKVIWLMFAICAGPGLATNAKGLVLLLAAAIAFDIGWAIVYGKGASAALKVRVAVVQRYLAQFREA